MQVDAHQPVHDAGASHIWLAPVAVFIAWFAALFERIARLKRIRGTTRFKPAWRDCWPGLRESEWHRHQMLAQGAALLLAGKTLDDAHYVNLPVPDDYGGPCPATPYEMKRRFAVIADWLRDPERHIRRHAERITRRAAHGSTDTALRAAAHHEAMSDARSGSAPVALIVSSDRRERPSSHEGGLANARAPPIIDYR